ncbi:MAG TPA: 4-(cytidine 5'-diphospho)-2-C-methyl-D-erythritol kinase [Cyclobacteriaceae bacterium]|nr:4-(cytidine 5'-diphospho)-2-C-methyl-D-erythritol kinase [Cyclobacteriaceae bacterium]
MVCFPHCKINLGLRVISKREDGYHNVDTCFYPVPWTDVLEILPAKTNSFTNSGIPIPGKPEQNLCLRAYYLLAEDFDLAPVSIHLHKIVPMGAGLGGGSSDAAFTLKLLNDIFELGLSIDQLKNYAAQLGSDCSFFVGDNPMLGSGRGEILDPINISLKGKDVVIVKPDVHISTAEAYKGIAPAMPSNNVKNIVENTPVEGWREVLVNDFEASVFRQHLIIAEIKQRFYDEGAIYASMSGSGASVFGIFDEPKDLSQKFGNMTYWSGAL